MPDADRAQVREARRLRSENAQLKVLARRYALQKRAERNALRAPKDTPPLPLQREPPPAAPVQGSRVR
jgi:hypothetical protein